eukprot:g2064.t1
MPGPPPRWSFAFSAAAAAVAGVVLGTGLLLARRRASADARAASAPGDRAKKKSGFAYVKRIILVRHGESLGNVDSSAYTRIGDNMIPLTAKGLSQARSCGNEIREQKLIVGAFRVYYSPYLRTRQTALEVVRGICGGNESVLRRVDMRSDPRLREQDFGNLQTSEGQHAMKVQQRARAKFGRFWYRFQNGESGADVYDRVGNFFGTLTRARGMVQDLAMDPSHDVGDGVGRVHAETIILVSHGLAMRLFLMRYFKWNVSEFEKVWNPQNCERWVLERKDGDRPFSFASFAQVRYGRDGRELPMMMRHVRAAGAIRREMSSAYDVLKDEVAQDLLRPELATSKRGRAGDARNTGPRLRKMSVFA